MKQIKVMIPPKLADHFAKWTFENGVRVLLSFSVDDFFDAKIVVICAVEEDKAAVFTTEFKNYIK